MQQFRRETLALITMLSPGLRTFRRVQLASAKARLGGAQQYLMRVMHRRVRRDLRWSKDGDMYIVTLPNGLQDGISICYHPNGICRRVDYARNGQLHGACMQWYETGQPWFAWVFVDGNRQGLSRSWYMSGHLARQCVFVDDKIHGEFKHWGGDGTLLEYIIYAHGVIVERKHDFGLSANTQ